jgi:TRAP-type C4-dicarboxylate transport system substrate-binding protein
LIDGAENNWPSYVTTGHYKSARYYTLTEHTMSPEVLIMSLGAWNSLSPEEQKIFREAARESNRYMREQWLVLEKGSREHAESAGVAIVSSFDRKPFEDAMSSVYAKALEDQAIARLIERIRQVQ